MPAAAVPETRPVQVDLGEGVVVLQHIFNMALEPLFALMWDNTTEFFQRFHALRKDTGAGRRPGAAGRAGGGGRLHV